jgi:hypothetical protein
VTLPALITVTATIGDSSGPQAGRIVWHRNTALYPAAGADLSYQIPEEVVSVVGADGILSQPLYACNDPVASPTGWTWTVTTFFPHWKETFDVVVPYDAAGGTIALNKLAPVPPDGDGALYALANHTHAGGGGGGGDIVSTQISDSTAVGRALLTAVNAAGARTTLQLGGAALLAVGTGSGNVAAGNAPALSLAAATAADVTVLAAATAAATTLANAALASATAADVTVLASATAAAAALLAAHTAASDPHPVYLTSAEGNAAYDASGAATSALAAHTAASDPHPQYLTTSEGNAAYDAIGAATSALASHTAASDPHTNYTSIYYWNGSAYAIVTGANVYVGGSGPASPTNGDLWFST